MAGQGQAYNVLVDGVNVTPVARAEELADLDVPILFNGQDLRTGFELRWRFGELRERRGHMGWKGCV